MALVVFDRVQETTATTGTGTITLGGAVAGYQSFAVVGNGNTTFYCILNGSAWEVGIGTYSTTGPTLARTTVLSNSSGTTSPINLVGASSVFVTYPSEKSVNLNASGNVSPLGTITSGVWNGTTIPVAYGGTGVTTSSGANSVVLRDANVNVSANNVLPGYVAVTAAAGTTTLTAASAYIQRLTGSTTQTFKLPDATTMVNGQGFLFDNDSSGLMTIVDNASGAVDTVTTGAADFVYLLDNSTSAGSWARYAFLPASYDFGTSTANFGGAILTNGLWNGTTIATGYGGTGLTGFSAANNAIYSTSSSALTAGTLPVAAGGTGITSLTAGYIPYGNGTGPFSSSSNLFWDSANSRLGIGTTSPATRLHVNGATNTTSSLYLQNQGTSIGVFGTEASWLGTGSSNNLAIASYSTNSLLFGTNGAEQVRITSDGNVGIGTSSPSTKLTVNGGAGTSQIRWSVSNSAYVEDVSTNAAQSAYVYKSSDASYHVWKISSSEAMRLDSNGNLLVGGTAVKNSAKVTNYGRYWTGSGTSSGDAELVFSNYASATAANSISVRQDVGGANNDLKFLYFDSAGTYQGVAMQIDRSGNLLVGKTTTSGGRFEVNANGLTAPTQKIFPTTGYRSLSCESGGSSETTDGMIYCFNNTAGSTSWAYYGAQSGVTGVVYKVYGNGNVVNANNSYGSISDIKLKENIVDATPKLDNICKLQVRNFNFIKSPEQKQLGLIAQEVETVFPGLIDEVPDRDEEGSIIEGQFTKNVKYSVLTPMLIKAIQELNAKVTALEAQLGAK